MGEVKIKVSNEVNIQTQPEKDFSQSELKLLNLIAILIVNISIRESYEKSDKIPPLQR
jgi:hypothetical protein